MPKHGPGRATCRMGLRDIAPRFPAWRQCDAQGARNQKREDTADHPPAAPKARLVVRLLFITIPFP